MAEASDQDGVEVQCSNCKAVVLLPFIEGSNQTRVSIEPITGWIFPPSLCDACRTD